MERREQVFQSPHPPHRLWAGLLYSGLVSREGAEFLQWAQASCSRPCSLKRGAQRSLHTAHRRRRHLELSPGAALLHTPGHGAEVSAQPYFGRARNSGLKCQGQGFCNAAPYRQVKLDKAQKRLDLLLPPRFHLIPHSEPFTPHALTLLWAPQWALPVTG